MKSEKNVPNEQSERFADVKVDKKYRIKFLEEENLQIVKAVITENNIKKKFLKFETLKDKTIYTCNYDSIKDATQLSTLLWNRIFWSAFILRYRMIALSYFLSIPSILTNCLIEETLTPHIKAFSSTLNFGLYFTCIFLLINYQFLIINF